MTRVEAIFENGVFRPLESVDLPEHERVVVTIESNRDRIKASLDALNRLRLHREQMAAKFGLMPDSTELIREDRER